jgi:PAS domain S-box-containing protein
VTLPCGETRQVIAERDARLAEIVRSASDAIIGETLDGRVTVWNRAAEELYGYSASEMVGRRIDSLYPPGSRAGEAAARSQVIGGHRLGGYVAERACRDGTVVKVSMRMEPIVDAAGAVIGVATISWAADAGSVGVSDAAVGLDAAGRVGHELRTSLNAILGFTRMLLLRLPGPLNNEQEHQLQLVQSSAETLLTRINQLSRPGVR